MGRRDLEILRRDAEGPGDGVPVLLVHGAWHGAWCWDRGFMARVAGAGHPVAAVSLRGHGGSGGRGPLARRLHGLAGYVDDVAAAAATLPAPPVVVGHSMGGLVVARYLSERRPARAGALLAPAPLTGVLPLTLRLLAREPAVVARVLATASCAPVVDDAARVARLFLAGPNAAARGASLAPELCDESFRAFLGMLVARVDAARVAVPVTVLAAGADAVFTADEARRTAEALRAPLVSFPGMGHDMMLEPGWPAVADAVLALCARVSPAARDRPARRAAA